MRQINIAELPPQITVDIMRNELSGIREKYRGIGLPSYMVEGVLCEVLADVRRDRAREVAEGYQALMMEEDKDDNTADKA